MNVRHQTLRNLLKQKSLITAPGVFDGLSARLAEQAGFQALYLSGGAIARSCGFPDLGLLGLEEVCQRMGHIAEVTTVPLIADADTGFGNKLNVRRTVRHFERLGISAFHLEDQTFPKRCGHLDGKTLITTAEMVTKIKTACDARQDDNIVLIARTDAIAVEGIDAALTRANAYIKAGADVIFVEAPQTIEQIEHIAQALPGPKLINMFHGGKTPMVAHDHLQVLGYQIVIIPSDLQRAAIYAMQQTLNTIRNDGDSQRVAEQLASFAEREQIIGTADYLS